ncbi:transporter substrate-binding domain-containing protein [Streptomyces sp. NPDC004579]|uniref:transporter substrate-binding domain-containing protein n=1 Tax=Streptomyces sp. NPDC004579 TaxID=3154667 RepID=UPI0033A4672C
MRRIRSWTALMSCALLAPATTACGSDAWPGGEEVRIGVKGDQPGTGFQNGSYAVRSGFDIKIARLAADALHKPPEFRNVPSEDRQTDLDGKHHIDLVVATYSINNPRLTGSNGLPAHDFAGPYAVTYQGFLVRKKGPRVRGMSDLKGKRVCTWTGTTSSPTIDQRTTGLVPVQDSDASKCVADLLSGAVDAVSSDQLILYGFTQLHKELEVVPHLTIGDAQYYGVGLPKKHRGACADIKKALKEYVNSEDWSRDFKNELPSIPAADPNWESRFKPRDAQLDTYSCRDRIGS